MVQGEFIMSKGTILYIGGFELPDKNAAAHRVLSNGKILRELGYEVIFIDTDRELEYGNSILKTKKTIQGFKCWSLPYPASKKEWIHYLSNIEFSTKIFDQINDVKAVVAYNYPAAALIALKSYCGKKGIKVIADCTEWYSTKGTNIIFKIIKGFDSFLRMRIIQKKLDGVIVISRYLENYYRKSHSIIRIPPLVDLTEEKWETTGQKIDDNIIRFVYAGSPGKNKDKLNLLIESLFKLENYNNYTFHIVGITKEQYIYDYMEHKGMLDNLGERVRFLGRLSHKESIKYLKMSDFSIFIRENTRLNKAGFPTKFVESISCGIPVITTKTSDLESYIVDGENGYFVDFNGSTSCSTEVLKKILELDNEEIKIMKNNCVKSENFHYKNYVKQTKKFIENVIN
jgi:glycosyltransferase involved in cell wall biosynthesis